jgi:hypothetical protein
MWTWRQNSGELVVTDDQGNGQVIATGYSGAGRGKNRTDYESVPDVGPIPRGQWSIVSLTIEETPHGPYVLHLAPCENTNTFGRSGFLIHGDSKTAPGEASKGCIILPRNVRERIWQSENRSLTVV